MFAQAIDRPCDHQPRHTGKQDNKNGGPCEVIVDAIACYCNHFLFLFLWAGVIGPPDARPGFTEAWLLKEVTKQPQLDLIDDCEFEEKDAIQSVRVIHRRLGLLSSPTPRPSIPVNLVG